jgi:hypothetical protein
VKIATKNHINGFLHTFMFLLLRDRINIVQVEKSDC